MIRLVPLVMLLAFYPQHHKKLFNITVLQTQSCNTGAGAGCTVTITTSPDSLIFVDSRQGANTTSTLSVTDSASQTYTQIGSYNTLYGTREFGLFQKANSAALSSLTCTWSGGISNTATCIVLEISNAATSSPVDATASNVGNTSGVTTLTSGSLTTTHANDILLAVLDSSTSLTSLTTPSGYTCPANALQIAGRSTVCYKIVTATQSGVTATYSWSNAAAIGMNFTSLKANN